jgi:spermidine/putrescine transport system permease protein
MAQEGYFSHSLGRWLLPTWTVVLLVFLYLPIVLLVVYSFNNSPTNMDLSARWHGFTLHWYRDMLADRILGTVVWNSLIIGAAATLISVLLGTAAAWLLHRFAFRLSTASRRSFCCR